MSRLFLSLLLVFAMGSSAHAGNVYFGLTGGVTIPEQIEMDVGLASDIDFDLDTGFNVGGAVGYDFGDIRTAFEYAFRRNAIDQATSNLSPGVVVDVDADFDVHTFMAAGYYDFNNKSKFTPYVGAGVGLALMTITSGSLASFGVAVPFDSQDETAFAYKFEGGANYELTPVLSLTGAYEYLGTSETDFGENGAQGDLAFNSHNFKAGLQYAF